jgi:hypothetical protein
MLRNNDLLVFFHQHLHMTITRIELNKIRHPSILNIIIKYPIHNILTENYKCM